MTSKSSAKWANDNDPLMRRRDNFAEFRNVASRLVCERGCQNVKPLVSIVIPTYRRRDLLKQAVISAAHQTATVNYEIVVVDNDPDGDASALTELAALEENRSLRYFVNDRNIGMTGNWNRGIELARGEWIGFLHDDDWLASSYLAEMTPLLMNDVVMAACEVATGDLDYHSTLLGTGKQEAILLDTTSYILSNVSPAPGILSRALLLRDIGGFDDEYYPCSDYVAYVNIARQGRTIRLRRKLAYYRTTDSTTFKADTLSRMIRFSRNFKRILLEREPRLKNHLAYIQAMAYWYSIDPSLASEFPERSADLLDHLSATLSRWWVLRKLLGILQKTLFRPRKASLHA